LVIAGIPHPTGIIFEFGDAYLDATVDNSTVSDYSQKLSFKTGVSEWAYTWSPQGVDANFSVTFEVLFSRERPNVVATKATITPSKDVNGSVTDILDGRSALRTYLEKSGLVEDENSISSVFHPNGLPSVTGVVYSTANFSNAYTNLTSRRLAKGDYVSSGNLTIGQTFDTSFKAGETATFYKFVGVASTDEFLDAKATATIASLQAYLDGWDILYVEHSSAWENLLTSSTVDDFTDPSTGELPEDATIKTLQITSVANAFYLLQSLATPSTNLTSNSVSVGGLGSDSYAGMVFWDADYWVAPGINIAFPDYAKQIANLRLKQYNQSLANAEFNNYPKGSSLYSWTTGRYGNCTGTGPCADYQYHLNYDIAFNLLQLYNVTNDGEWFEAGPRDVVESVATMTGSLLKLNETTEKYWIYNMTDPDEYAVS
jgi:trehalose/maltose hydrolase-like predicted phosphorylase